MNINLPVIQSLPSAASTPGFSTVIHDAVRLQCKNLFFRQSLISDYLTCPQMALYRWVFNLEEEQPWFAALLGTAGHEVVFKMHENHFYSYTYIQLLEMFETAFNDAIQNAPNLPALGKDYNSVEDEFSDKAPEYVKMLQGYQAHNDNINFHSVLHEQSFVLIIPVDRAGSEGNCRSTAGPTNGLSEGTLDLNVCQGETTGRDDQSNGVSETPESFILFTGTIDQCGFYSDGRLSIRDLKFKDNAFRPGYTELSINYQLTVYAAALAYGVPTCNDCKPTYITDPFTGGKSELTYNGPCEKCLKLYNSQLWPKRHPDEVELIWMRDFLRREKDQYPRFIKDPQKIKEKNPMTGRMVIREIVNPEYHNGYKIGDFKGKGFYRTNRPESKTRVLMSDVVKIANQVRKAAFYRKPSEQCNFFCKYKEQCIGAVETEIEQLDMSKVGQYATINPFDE